jgi:hypothetical protein
MTMIEVASGSKIFSRYELGQAYDELFSREGTPRPHYQALYKHLQ